MQLLVLIAATVASYGVAWLVAVPALVPLLNALPAFLFLFATLRSGQVGRALLLMFAWAATLAVMSTGLSWLDEAGTAGLFVNADAYRGEMVAWIRTGIGAESTPARFLPMHALHAVLFCVLSIVSGGVLSMPMGAVLMNYMGHFVGTLAAASANPIPTALAAWFPWSLVRITSYVTLGVLLAGPLLSRVGRFGFSLRAHARWLAAAMTGLVLDVVLKAALAPHWPPLLRALTGW